MPPKDLSTWQFCELFVDGQPIGRASQAKISSEGLDVGISQYYKPIEFRATVNMDLQSSDCLQHILESAIPSMLYRMLQKINNLAEQYRKEKWQGRRHRRELLRQYNKLYKQFDHYCKIYGVTYSVAH